MRDPRAKRIQLSVDERGARLTLPLRASLVSGARFLPAHRPWLSLQLAKPIFTAPTFSFAAIVGIALPLFIVTMASQNVPGVAVIRASGYAIPISPVVGWTGVTNLLLAPFGAFAPWCALVACFAAVSV